MGSAQSAFDPSYGPQVVIPADYVTPTFPSLYVPSFSDTQNQVGIFLYDAEAIWHFTLYWTLITICGTFLVCALIASANLLLSMTLFRPSPPKASSTPRYSQPAHPGTPPVANRNHTGPGHTPNTTGFPTPGTPITPATASSPLVSQRIRATPKRPPLWIIALIPVVALLLGAVISIITATVIGFALAAVYSAGGFSMSTWVPFLWSLIQLFVLIISYVFRHWYWKN